MQQQIIPQDAFFGVEDAIKSIEASPDHGPVSLRLGTLFYDLPIACLCYDAKGNIMEWNRRCEELFPYSGLEVSVLEQPVWNLLGRLEDRELLKALVTSVLKGITFTDFEWEDLGPDQARRHLLSTAYPIYGDEREVVGGVIATIDMTQRKLMEHALWENDQRWQLALRGNNDGIWDWDFKADKFFFSARWKELLGYEEAEFENSRKEWFEHIHPADHDRVELNFQQHLGRQTTFYSSEHRMRCKNGSYKWVLDRAQGLWNRNGEIMRVAGSLTDITERKQYEQKLIEANRRLEDLANRDGLTGLRNHRAFQDFLDMAFERFQRYDEPVSIVLLDVDKFKSFNDTHGHLAGDTVLKGVAKILEKNMRDADMAARYGGEEFVLLLAHTNLAGAAVVAERCRVAIEAAEWSYGPVTASFGFATVMRDMSVPSDLIKEADDALYVSKEQGRNRVTCARGLIKIEAAQ